LRRVKFNVPQSEQDNDLERRRIHGLYRQWVVLRQREESIKQRINELRNKLLAYAEAYGVEDAKGHRVVEIDPITIGGRVYGGWVRRKRVSQRINEERTRALAEEKGLVDEIFKPKVIEELDQDALYRLNQEGQLTDEELDSLVDTTVTYALEGI